MGWLEVAMNMMPLVLEKMTSRKVVLFIECHEAVDLPEKKILQKLIIYMP